MSGLLLVNYTCVLQNYFLNLKTSPVLVVASCFTFTVSFMVIARGKILTWVLKLTYGYSDTQVHTQVVPSLLNVNRIKCTLVDKVNMNPKNSYRLRTQQRTYVAMMVKGSLYRSIIWNLHSIEQHFRPELMQISGMYS